MSKAQVVERGFRERVGKLAPRLFASLVIAAGFVWVLRRGGLPMLPSRAALAPLSFASLASYLGLYALMSFLRTYRWNYLLRPLHAGLSSRRVLGVGFVGFAAVLFAPLRMGEVVRPWLLSQDGEVSFLQATGTVVAERVVDGLTLTLILVVSLFAARPLDPLPSHVGQLALPVAAVPRAAGLALGFFAAAFLAMAAFYFFRELARRAVHALVGPISEPLANFIAARLERIADGLRFLPSSRHAGAFVRDTLAYWAATSLSFVVLLRACGARLGLAEACVTMGIMGIGTLIPSGPGFFGSYQLSAYCGLAMFLPESEVLAAGAAFTFVSYTVQLVVTALSCPFGFWLMSTASRSSATEPPNPSA